MISGQQLAALEKRIKSVCQVCTFGHFLVDSCTLGHFLAFLAACDFASCSLNYILPGQVMPFLRPFNAVSHTIEGAHFGQDMSRVRSLPPSSLEPATFLTPPEKQI
jgi:hypothetical protein